MPTSTRNLTLDFMQTEKGQFSSFKLNAILGLKYNHQNKNSHNFLVQFQNINTNYVETIELSPELLRYKFKLGSIYKQSKVVSKGFNEFENYIEIDTFKMKEQLPLHKVLSKKAILNILGENDFNFYKYRVNYCYVHEDETSRYIIPSYVIALYYYFKSSSMKEALYKGNPFSLYNEIESNLSDKTDATLVLETQASKLDGPFIYRFLTNSIAQKGFIDFSRYISSYKNKRDLVNKVTNIIPIKALFPTREILNIKIRYTEIEDYISDKTTYIVNEIKNDDSTLDFEKLTVLKKKKKEAGVDLDDSENFSIKGRKPKKRRKNVTTSTPSLVYGTNKIREIENTQNLSLIDKDITYGSIEEENSNPAIITEKEEKGIVSVSFSKGDNVGDETSQQSKLETDNENKKEISKPPVFNIFLESIEFIENTSLVSEFYFDDLPKRVPESKTKSGNLTSMCSIDNQLKKYVSCSFKYNETNVVLIEVESENNDFATWVVSSKNEITKEDISELLELRYSKLKNIQSIKNVYKDVNTLKFSTHRHAQINDGNEHEEVLERWLLRLFNKVITCIDILS